jgi:hypothetical protein
MFPAVERPDDSGGSLQREGQAAEDGGRVRDRRRLARRGRLPTTANVPRPTPAPNVCIGTRPHLLRDWAKRTSAPRLGLTPAPPRLRRDWPRSARRLPHLFRDWSCQDVMRRPRAAACRAASAGRPAQRAACHIRRATCNMQHATRNAQHTTCSARRATCDVQRAVRAACDTRVGTRPTAHRAAPAAPRGGTQRGYRRARPCASTACTTGTRAASPRSSSRRRCMSTSGATRCTHASRRDSL